MEIHRHIVAAIIFVAFLVVSVIASELPSVRMTPTVRAVSQSVPWVVSIATENLIQVNDGYETLFHEFFGRIRLPKQKIVRNYSPLGSGIIVSSAGLIITNLHVVRRAETLDIRLWNGDSYHAAIVGFDEPNDLALLQIKDDLPQASFKEACFGKPDDLLLGETVITIGNPFGLDHSVSQGVLSAINRSLADDDQSFDDILQTDAAINPGNSGGPLINLSGEVIGINQAIRRDASGIGFAIPTKRIEQFLAHWLLPSRFSSAAIGLNGNGAIRQGMRGVIFESVIPKSAAAKAGLKNGDEIISVNHTPTPRMLDFGRQVWNLKKGDHVILTTAAGGRYDIALEDMSDEALIYARLGIHVQTLTPEFCQAVSLPKDCKGVVLNEILPETEFANQLSNWRKSLKRGDIILKIQDDIIESEKALARHLRTKTSGNQETIVALVYDNTQSELILVQFQAYLK